MHTLIKAAKCEILKGYFKGILFCNTHENNPIKKGKIGDFHVINTDGVERGEHWFTIVRGSNMWILLDCSVLTPISKYNSIKSRLNIPLIIDRNQIEGFNSLLCGEFSLMAAIQMTRVLREHPELNYLTYPKNFYSTNVSKYVGGMKTSDADAFVFKYIYTTLAPVLNIRPEKVVEVKKWLKYKIK